MGGECLTNVLKCAIIFTVNP